MNRSVIYLSPYEYSCVTGIPLPDVMQMIQDGKLPAYYDDEGMYNPVTYN